MSSEDLLLLTLQAPVAVVGNGALSGCGSTIDAFASVIRINLFTTVSFESACGTRTTHWCVRFHVALPEERGRPVPFTPYSRTETRRWSARTDIVFARVSMIERLRRHARDVLVKRWHQETTGFALTVLLLDLGFRPTLFGFDGLETGHYFNPGHQHWPGHARRARNGVPARVGRAVRRSAVSTVRVFVGTEERAWKADTALEHSIWKVTPEPLEIRYMSEALGGVWTGWNMGRLHRMPYSGQGWATNFTCFRWAVPELCAFRGRAIYLDSDQVVLRDLRVMFDLPMEGAGMLILRGHTDVALMDCSRFAAPAWPRLETMKASGWGMRQYKALASEVAGFGPLPEEFNCLDGQGYDPAKTRLVHYTAMETQPWRPYPEKFTYPAKHPAPGMEELWWATFEEALVHGTRWARRGITLGATRASRAELPAMRRGLRHRARAWLARWPQRRAHG